MKKRQYSALQDEDHVHCEKDAPPTQIHNIVSTTQIMTDGPAIDLQTLSELLPYSHYDRKRFAAITIRIGEPNCTTLLFTSGKLVITGGVSWYECMLAAKLVTRILQRNIITQTFWCVSCEIQNIVAKACVPLAANECLNIDLMYERLNSLCTFQKNMFPGLIFRPVRSPVVLLCFQSGKVVITGGKTEEDVSVGWARLWPLVQEFITPAPA
jgi:transcription initiation factor TFIID TATA-box-binding protein